MQRKIYFQLTSQWILWESEDLTINSQICSEERLLLVVCLTQLFKNLELNTLKAFFCMVLQEQAKP